MEYRKGIALSTEVEYWHVRMGPVPDMPEWHQKLYSFQSYPFPTKEAADRFAETHRMEHPGRIIEVVAG